MKKSNKKISEPKTEKLIDFIFKQMESIGMIVERGSFGDKSGSWLECHKTKEVKEMKRYCLVFSFNYEGTILTNTSCYKEEFVLRSEGTKIIF